MKQRCVLRLFVYDHEPTKLTFSCTKVGQAKAVKRAKALAQEIQGPVVGRLEWGEKKDTSNLFWCSRTGTCSRARG